MLKVKNLIVLLVFSVLGQTQVAQALVMDTEGASSSGLNDTAATAQAIGTLNGSPLTVFGYIDSNNVNDIDLYGFTLGGTSRQTVYFDIDFANDILTPLTDDDDSLDAYLHVFTSAGALLGSDDDVGFTPDPGSGPNGDYDPFMQLVLDPGDYIIGVTSFSNTSDGLDNWTNGGGSVGQYCLEARTGQGFDAPANNCSGNVPEPSMLGLMWLGLGLIGMQRLIGRRRS